MSCPRRHSTAFCLLRSLLSSLSILIISLFWELSISFLKFFIGVFYLPTANRVTSVPFLLTTLMMTAGRPFIENPIGIALSASVLKSTFRGLKVFVLQRFFICPLDSFPHFLNLLYHRDLSLSTPFFSFPEDFFGVNSTEDCQFFNGCACLHHHFQFHVDLLYICVCELVLILGWARERGLWLARIATRPTRVPCSP